MSRMADYASYDGPGPQIDPTTGLPTDPATSVANHLNDPTAAQMPGLPPSTSSLYGSGDTHADGATRGYVPLPGEDANHTAGN